jgi:hypothetical protein
MSFKPDPKKGIKPKKVKRPIRRTPIRKSYTNSVQLKKPTAKQALMEKAVSVFNAFIRKRDENEPCIVCGRKRQLQAGHFYPAGSYPMMKFLTDNCHGECAECNCFDTEHLDNYRINLIKKIGIDGVKILDSHAAYSKKSIHKWTSHDLEEIIKHYTEKLNNYLIYNSRNSKRLQ